MSEIVPESVRPRKLTQRAECVRHFSIAPRQREILHKYFLRWSALFPTRSLEAGPCELDDDRLVVDRKSIEGLDRLSCGFVRQELHESKTLVKARNRIVHDLGRINWATRSENCLRVKISVTCRSSSVVTAGRFRTIKLVLVSEAPESPLGQIEKCMAVGKSATFGFGGRRSGRGVIHVIGPMAISIRAFVAFQKLS